MLTGESRIEPPQFILKMNKLPICFIISFRGILKKIVSRHVDAAPRLPPTPIFPVSESDLGRSLVWSMVDAMSSSKREILTDCDKACESDSFVLQSRASAASHEVKTL